jgi:hypothetical protein
MNTSSHAPCIAVVGPANAGKTTLLYQLDQRLKRRLDCFMVIKGNPDGTGLYLYHAPELRNAPELKKSVKGIWGAATIDRICEWITHGRRNLSLTLLDFGGRHDAQTAEGNARMLRTCSHYLVVSRANDDDGGEYWAGVCRSHGLTRLAWMHSLAAEGPEPTILGESEDLQATFRVDARPADPVNDAVLAPLVGSLLGLSRSIDHIPYVNLWQTDDWRMDQIPTVGGQFPKITQLVSRTGVVVLGGAAPVWAYLAGLRCALRASPAARVFFFDPKQPECLVEIPAVPQSPGAPSAFPADALRISWQDRTDRSVLQFEITTEDKFLPPSAAENLAGSPQPPPAPNLEVALSGKAPLWIYGTYARWLIAAGAEGLATWDMRTKSFIQVWDSNR